MRVFFLGMQGSFSLPPLQALLSSAHEITAVLVPAEEEQPSGVLEQLRPEPAPVDELSLFSPYVAQTLVTEAWRHEIPVYAVNQLRDPQLAQWLRDQAPDVACVACFNRIIPLSLLSIPHHGFLNLHPSHLPHYRGPEPLFWQLRNGVNPVGITVHWMDAGVDTGDIAAQTDVPLPDGLRWTEIEQTVASEGAGLLVAVLDAIAQGTVTRRPQVEEGSYQPLPGVEDFRLSLDWTAQRAFNFMRGTAAWGMPYDLIVGEETLQLTNAWGWIASDRQPGQIKRVGERLEIGFAQGVLVAS